MATASSSVMYIQYYINAGTSITYVYDNSEDNFNFYRNQLLKYSRKTNI